MTGQTERDSRAPEPFGARLRRAMDTRGPLCVGIDPHASLLHAWGLNDDVAGLERFSRTVVEALADRVAVLKPQSAFFERFGSAGVAVLERTLSVVGSTRCSLGGASGVASSWPSSSSTARLPWSPGCCTTVVSPNVSARGCPSMPMTESSWGIEMPS